MQPPQPGYPPSPSLLSPSGRPAPPRTDDLPTYAQTQAASPSSQRFTRWGGWVDKRTQERQHPDPRPSSSSSSPNLDLTPRHHLEPHQDYLPTPCTTDDGTRPRSTSAASSSSGPRSTLRLSRSSLLDRLGSRFDHGIPDEPSCAVPLPTSHTHDDRLVLVGTANGLYLVDLAPVSASAPLTTSARSPADARTLCVWHGIGVHHLEVHVDVLESTARTAARMPAPTGCVVALVDVAHERQVRTWSLEALVNLATWRAMDEHSVPLELVPAHFSTSSSRSGHMHGHHHHGHHHASTSSTSSAATSPSTSSRRRPSFPFLHKTTHASPVKDAQVQPSSSSSPSSSPATSASASRLSLHPLDVGAAPASALGPPPPPSAPTSASSPSMAPQHLEQPLEWATSGARLVVPKSAGAVVACRLFRMPPPTAPSPSASPRSAGQWAGASSSDDDGESDSDGYDDAPGARRAHAERERRRVEAGRALLVVVGSARSVCVFELAVGSPGAGAGAGAGEGLGSGREGRIWTLTREFFAPSTPRFLDLVRTTSPPAPSPAPLRATTSRPSPTSYTPPRGPTYPPDLHLVLGTSHRVVLVSLATAAVHEVDVVAPSMSDTSPSTSTRRRAGSAASSRSELSPPQGSSALGHRKTPSRAAVAAATAALGLGELRKSLSALVGGTGSGGGGGGGARGGRAVPAGMDEGEVEGLVAGRRVDEERRGVREPDKGSERERARWTGCDVVALPGSGARSDRRSGRHTSSPTRTRSLVLLTRGSTSYLVPSLPCPAPLGAPDPPLGLDRSPSSPSSSFSAASPTGAGPADSLALDVRHAFHHALGPVRRVVALMPPALEGENEGEGRPVRLVVCAFAETGLAVQESGVVLASGLVAPLAVPGVAREALRRETGPERLGEELGAADEEEEDDPPPDAATLDFARATRFLCGLGRGGGAGSGSGAATGALFAVEGRGGWGLQRLAVAL
ncbi:uncharacterized protein RHOBADRAFT_51114 [Rhodotorula graminis WP1]|uniref:Uncharacterized protein n=1 Tax=Rhodotorula graminis (strain WP1) TaxID=578459 RepID=A0A194SDK4_RHOGW|nr:uncharacterized protein RHOBADRAFT_51114 [Rhodotorula graminis WP1]KPV78677.1 hypothetical protein RHOBADRAFT_51114 [Rhodotorula graminis WP1]